MDAFVETKFRGLIPILNPLDVECNLYMIRLTPQEKYERKDIEEWLDSFTKNWVCAKENSKKAVPHYHVTVYDILDEDVVREKIRNFLKKYFLDPPKRGDANKQYNMTIADSTEKGLNYTVKELDISYGKGMNPKYMDQRIKESFVKFDRQDIAKQVEKLKADFKTKDHMRLSDFMIEFVLIKAQYRQPINMTYIYQLGISCEINRDKKHAERYVQAYFDKNNF